MAEPVLRPCGDTALSVEFGDRIDPRLHDQVLALAAALEVTPPEGVVELVPTYRALMLHYDPLRTSFAVLSEEIVRLQGQEPATRHSRRWTIPVCYGGAFGADLEEVARAHGLTPDQVISLHSEAEYRVYMLGFAPGYAYLGGLQEALHTPRRPDPRSEIPPGSISIGGQQALLCARAMPSGWHLLGRTPFENFTPATDPPVQVQTGDVVQFSPISKAQFADLQARQAAGETIVAVEAL